MIKRLEIIELIDIDTKTIIQMKPKDDEIIAKVNELVDAVNQLRNIDIPVRAEISE